MKKLDQLLVVEFISLGQRAMRDRRVETGGIAAAVNREKKKDRLV